MLYPRESESRQLRTLSGLWRFKADYLHEGRKQNWQMSPLEGTINMPVPASYNDITQDEKLRDHIGDVWYEKTFFVPLSWREERVMLRVGSASHHATVWVNGVKVTEHSGGFLPFEGELSSIINYGEENRISIVVNNVLDWNSLPPGEVKHIEDEQHPKGYKIQEYHYDFFNYAGIHRPVILYTTPKTYIEDITVTTDIKDKIAVVHYEFKTTGEKSVTNYSVELLDKEGNIVASEKGNKDRLMVENPKLWQPGEGYLYTFRVSSFETNGDLVDRYRLPIGIRTVEIKGEQFLINGKPFYFKGFGKHEDSDFNGRGLNDVINVKDFNLLEWSNANSFRTSHYPYSEEIMDLADELGIVVIDEVPAVGMNIWGQNIQLFNEDKLGTDALNNHIKTIKDLIKRDKNHPSVVMWSVGNEAATFEDGSVPYFKKLAEFTRELDNTRPVTLVQSSKPKDDKVAQLFDIICLNRYYSWYEDPGHLELIDFQLEKELKDWYAKYKQPIIITEYGADAIAGFHQDPPVMFTEEYQCEMIKEYHKVMDRLPFVIGEHVWNFADFATKQGVTRIVGNKKGVFTRQRQPKAAAHMLRKRWLAHPKE
ncbi:beta-glucuronidase [Evansella cellulosilytica]|uniref:Beta-glucuronidase n=1 Tax=Evansella cellulosilytica (strain ATCC 21833 / DSM 2522 / FERM P-1141 / JCM 9156 / N-4) TaxID=649639 RepID=E6TZA4_EVAC2|nr:beta-glucuronidase [Evansella cellulosilytica]ADU28966.1 Beta-glucuronidase [Evansella cellulosilytica DSM 2522]